MEPWRVFFFVFLIQSSFGASVLKDVPENYPSLTSELSDSFAITVAKSAAALDSILENRDADFIAPVAVDVNEKHKVVDSQPEVDIKVKSVINEEVKKEEPIEKVVVEKKEPVENKPVEKKEPAEKEALEKKEPVKEEPVEEVSSENKESVEGKEPPKAELLKKVPDIAIDSKPKDEAKIEPAVNKEVDVKPVEAVSFKKVPQQVPVDKPEPEVIAADERPKEEEVDLKVAADEKSELIVPAESAQVSEAAQPPSIVDRQEAPVSPPNIIQQGIITVQQGISNLTSGLTSIIRPNNDEGSASPPSIIQNIQDSVSQGVQNFNQSIQNLVNPRPPADTTTGTEPTSPFAPIQQGIQNIQQGISQGLQNVTQAFQNFFNRNDSQPGILEQGVQSLSQTVSQTFQNLNQSIQAFTNPTPDNPNIIQVGIQSLQSGAQNISSGIQGIFTPQDNNSNILQQTVQSAQNAISQGVTNLNNTIQSFFSPQQSGQTNIFQSFSNSLQNLFSGARPAGNQSVREQFRLDVNSLNDTLYEGIKNITETLEVTPIRSITN